MSPRIRSLAGRYATLLKLAFTSVVLGLLIGFVGWRALLEALAAASGTWIAAMYGVVLVNFVVMGACLHGLLTKAGVVVSLGRVLTANALATLYALVVPGDLMAGVSKWVVLSAATGQRTKVLSAIVLNKIALALPPLFFGTLALSLESPVPQLPVAEIAAFSSAVTAAGLLLVLHRGTGPLVDRRLRALSRNLPWALPTAAEKLLEALAAFRVFGFRDHLQILALCVLAFWLGILSLFCATHALGIDAPIVTLVWISLALFISRLLPITFNNLGVREGLLILALGTSQVDPARALGVGLLLFSNAVWIGLLGAGCQVAIALGWVRLGDETASRVRDRRSIDLGDRR